MLKGLAITPPTIGRITIGKVIERNGKRLPSKDDQFTITTQLQGADGQWLVHPIDEALRTGQDKQGHNKPGEAKQSDKLRTIPVRLLFNDPDLNLTLRPHDVRHGRWQARVLRLVGVTWEPGICIGRGHPERA